MIIGLTGAGGFIGSHFTVLATSSGHTVIPFSRKPGENARPFSLTESPDLSGLDAIVHLAGEPVLGYWTREKKRRITESRVLGTRRIVEALKTMPNPPGIFVCASAIGYYGDTEERIATEESQPGRGFLAETCQAWEIEAAKADSGATRVVRIRIGFVLGHGGAMRLIAPVFRFGLGGRLGSGNQWMSCIHVDDIAGMILLSLGQKSIHGPINAVMPEPVRNSEFTLALADMLRRPAIFPAPAFLLRTALGEMSHAILDSSRVMPTVAVKEGYSYKYSNLSAALRASI